MISAMTVRRAKIVCTLGPAVDSPKAIRGLIQAGMDVARLNFSHGTADEHRKRAAWVREASRELNKPIAILQDLCGPKIRTGVKGPAEAPAGGTVYLVAGSESTESHTIAINYESVASDVKPGDHVLLGDGHVDLRVESVDGDRVACQVIHGGKLRARMGVNLPSRRVRLSALTDKDKADVQVGMDMGVDYVALSFVRNAKDIQELRAITALKRPDLPIVAKIETPGAMDVIDDIVKASDAVMVARGDLGVELPPERVPTLQKRILASCHKFRRPAIVATEMLQSMVSAPRPTRAEASDVANAVFEGTDAVMLSAETASGDFPLVACAMMDRIVRDAETSSFYSRNPSPAGEETQLAIAEGACTIARDIGAKVLVAITTTGDTARVVSKGRPVPPIVAFSSSEEICRRGALLWGVFPRTIDIPQDFNDLVDKISHQLQDERWLATGDRYVMSYGAPIIRRRGSTNAIRVEQIH